MNALISKLWILVIAYGGFEIYEMYIAHQEKMVELADNIPRIEKSIETLQNEKRQISSYLRDIEKAKENIEIVAQEVEKLQKKLPDAIKDAENLAHIGKIANDLNIKGVKLSPGKEENKGFYITKQYIFKGEGTYLQFLIFFEKIGSSERLLNVKEAKYEKSKEKQRGRFQLTNAEVVVEAYRYNPNHKEDRGIQNIEKGFDGGAKGNTKKTKKKGKK